MKIGVKPQTWLDPRQVLRATREATVDSFLLCAIITEREAKIILSKGGGRAKVSSPAGEPPHVQTGNLRSSICFAETWDGAYIIGPTTNAWYGKVLEFGPTKIKVTKKMRGYLGAVLGMHLRKTTTHITIKAHPFMRPALVKAIPKFLPKFRNLALARTPAGRRLNSRKL